MREAVRLRANDRCEYCQLPVEASADGLVLDHVIRSCAGGESALANLAWSCPSCNARKRASTHAVDPASKVLTRSFDPRNERWRDHFAWTSDLMRIEPLTATGRATVGMLDLNRQQILWLRGMMLRVGLSPRHG
jgi:hypothetical protein